MAGCIPHNRLPWLVLVAVLSCSACYVGTARDMRPDTLEDPGWLLLRNVPLIRQADNSDCGAAALAMLMSYWGQWTNLEEITSAYPVSPGHGIKAGALRDFARAKGFDAFVFEGKMEDVALELRENRPLIVGLIKVHTTRVTGHYEVVVGIHPGRKMIATLDPAHGWRENSFDGFWQEWSLSKYVTLIVFRSPATQQATLQTDGIPPAPEGDVSANAVRR